MDRRAGEEGSIKVSNKTAPPRPAPRLYLATPVLTDPASLAADLPGLLGAADVAAVLVRLKETDPRSMISAVKALTGAIQGAGAALLIDGYADLVARSGADGAHLSGIAALDEALPTLRPDRIAGVGALATRHDSMTAGERGADYVLFGEPDAHGSRPSTDAIAERLGWWAELFEPPCIGYAATREEATEFVVAGADFILVDDLVWQDARGPVAALAELGDAIKAAYTAPTTAAQR
jgi:thiamine-phosphate pyrophosphorylase